MKIQMVSIFVKKKKKMEINMLKIKHIVQTGSTVIIEGNIEILFIAYLI